PREDGFVPEFLHIDAGTDEHHRWTLFALQKAPLVFQRGVDSAFHTVGSRYRLSVNRCQPPSIGVITQHSICNTQWLDGRCESNHRKIWNKKKDNRPLNR